MKLISLYIENFGGLHEYTLNFEEGLTVVHAPNGFGKTTLAEFIRAMFYGFPRKAKTLDKSKRQKYTPWQGGRFGGHLTFQLEGKQYRIERSFGSTPKGDTFTLIDLTDNRPSDRFTDEIGLQLFHLDYESFERSTYMPQMYDADSLTTDNIQAKLGDLVEDTGDVGNYDKAVAALRVARSSLVPYKGNGGSVAAAREQISLIQSELNNTQVQADTLPAAAAEAAQLEEDINQEKQQLADLRNRISLAAEASAVEAIHREHNRLHAAVSQLEAHKQALLARYPAGIPQEDLLDPARHSAARIDILKTAETDSAEDEQAAQTRTRYSSLFADGVPPEDALEKCRQWIKEYHAHRTEAKATGLSDAEKAQYAKLRPLFEAGLLEEARLNALEEAGKERAKKLHQLETLSMSASDQSRMDLLERYFALGVPEMSKLQGCKKDLTRA